MGTCIFCASPENLNTSLNITLDDGTKVQVAICDEHAEEATVKTARAAYLNRQSQIEAVLAQARALGITLPSPASIAPTQNNLVIAQQQPGVVPQPQQPHSVPAGVAPLLEDDGEGVIVPKARLSRTMTSVGGSVGIGDIRANIPSYASHNLNENITDKAGNSLPAGALDGQMKLVEVEGRDGMPLALPSTIRDGTGTTRLRVVRTDDQSLQKRFKSIAQASLQDGGPDYRHNYDQNQEHRCPVCRGERTVVNRGRVQACPKCGGTGFI